MRAGSGSEVIHLSKVFQHPQLATVDKDAPEGTKQREIGPLRYALGDSEQSRVKAQIQGAKLILKAASGSAGSTRMTVYAIDDYYEWYDHETFAVNCR